MLRAYTRAGLEKVFYDATPGTDKSYIKYFNREILPLANAGTSADVAPQAATDFIHKLLGKCPLLTFDRLHNGGSFGRCTLVRGAFDVDLSVFVTQFKGRVLNYWAGDWSGEAGEALQEAMMRDVAAWLRDQRLAVLEVETLEHGTHYKHVINVKVAVQTGGLIKKVDVDLKMAANVVQGSGPPPVDRSKAQRDALMKQLWSQDYPTAEPAREAALAESLTAVVKQIPDWNKAVVRLVKCWYKYGGVEERVPHVPSVLLEVLALAAAQRTGQLNTKSPGAEVAVLVAALELLHAAVSRREVVLLEAGPVWGYTRQQALGCQHVWRPDPVVVLHPIDPTCNLARSKRGRHVDWAALGREARALRQVVLSGSMWDLLNRSSLGHAINMLEKEM
ncbi:hypothetical protein HXX76_012512 [Chlamydomonas incerta]|uniref:2'-5'-oligoadenylate synthetase 1 domain-containing protein n=1 Tax=Chlamydomonas incerta TaxID=51695 RepID=A0A835VS83_CHLIN|nr:hypothetical protein HXX76_012512 [Chlamydomonas incerta]|eukprot:KAG2427317.1 hypothetical protein HXX76_012512 [Chlamydomonas incerta]